MHLFKYLASFFALLLFSLSSQGLVVLQYHHIDDKTPPSTSISPALFKQHMQLIEDLGLEVVDLESATRAILSSDKKDHTYEKKLVAISFDDAYVSIFNHAYPELKRRNWPFTVFVNTQAVNEKNRGIMTWQQIEQLADDNVTIANHSVSHPHLPSVPQGLSIEEWLEKEILTSQHELQRRLKKSSNMLAYPYGEFSLEMIPWLAEHDILAFGQQSGPIGPMSHPQALSRYPASGIYSNLETLKTKLLTIALPISADQFKNPILTKENNPPELSLMIPEADYNPKQLQCFASQQGAIKTSVKIKDNQVILMAQAPKALQGKRARYNCTVLSSQKSRFYWYSQPWQMY